METLRLIDGSTKYPIGDHITSNLPVINSMATAIMDLIHSEYNDRDTILLICRGSSGAIIAGIVANILLINFAKIVRVIHIKKENEHAHATHIDYELFTSTCVNIVIDDFISTGTTIQSIVDKIQGLSKLIQLNILCVSGQGLDSDMINDVFEYQIISK